MCIIHMCRAHECCERAGFESVIPRTPKLSTAPHYRSPNASRPCTALYRISAAVRSEKIPAGCMDGIYIKLVFRQELDFRFYENKHVSLTERGSFVVAF